MTVCETSASSSCLVRRATRFFSFSGVVSTQVLRKEGKRKNQTPQAAIHHGSQDDKQPSDQEEQN
jgi:hypothetical protein